MASKSETLSQTKQRHKLEMRTLQNDVKAFQKKAKKDRMSKKDVEAQIQAMESEAKQRHEEELLAFETEEEPLEATIVASEQPADVAASVEPAVLTKVVKAQRKREAKKKQERERRERIEEANKHTVSERQIEADMIQAQLARHGLTIKDIPSDGHCMYHAVADQMAQRGLSTGNSDGKAAFQYLRELTSDYMLAHPDDFLPFVALEEAATDPQEAFETYCNRVANTADWGGQLELRALACALQRPIEVYSAEGDALVMGGEFANGDDESSSKPLQLTYHLHYYTLGEHFNSVKPQ
ncbi:hypothetical protein BBJ28_00002811 [Nothophytophthora sp. Chile5]|nr:hypothetical protein BBJ28_00002811 [Nothophytophthora sp. Chile5]